MCIFLHWFSFWVKSAVVGVLSVRCHAMPCIEYDFDYRLYVFECVCVCVCLDFFFSVKFLLTRSRAFSFTVPQFLSLCICRCVYADIGQKPMLMSSNPWRQYTISSRTWQPNNPRLSWRLVKRRYSFCDIYCYSYRTQFFFLSLSVILLVSGPAM